MASRRENVRIGEVLNGRWRILKKLGQGGMGAVYEAEHVTNGRRAAIKIMLPAFANDSTLRKMFQREGRLNNEVESAIPASVRKTTGPVEVYDSGTLKDGSPYMVMELLSGETVEERAWKRGGKLSMKDTANVLDATLRAVEGAHKKDVVHRDIKPANLFLTQDGDVKLLDFGIARKGGKRDYLSGITGVGTPGFMSPEQARGESVGPEADVYSVGATGFRLLTGKYLPKRPKHQPHVRAVNPSVPSRLAKVVDKAIAPQVADRYHTARAMRKDLETAITKLAASGNAEAKKLIADIRSTQARHGGGGGVVDTFKKALGLQKKPSIDAKRVLRRIDTLMLRFDPWRLSVDEAKELNWLLEQQRLNDWYFDVDQIYEPGEPRPRRAKRIKAN